MKVISIMEIINDDKIFNYTLTFYSKVRNLINSILAVKIYYCRYAIDFFKKMNIIILAKRQ